MAAPARFGRYEVRRAIGRGGMGVVYEGYDPQIDRPVAIKTIALDALTPAESAEFEARFRAEMRSAGRLLHPNIVAIHDTGREDGTAYIVMEFVEGSDLRQRLAAGERFETAQALAIALPLLDALEYAHAHHVVHRDVKPANVMLPAAGGVKLCDFGVAHLADADATRTRGLVVGTVRYASPEQVAGAPVDARSDVYSAAVLIYELLAGKPPIEGRSDVEILARIGRAPPAPPSTLNPALPAAFDAVLLKALAADPAERYPSAAAFAAALRAAAGAADAPTVPLTAPPPAPRRSVPWWAVAAAAAPLVVVGGWLLRPKAIAEPASAASAPAAAASRSPLSYDGQWSGRYECGDLVVPQGASARSDAFGAKVSLEIHGARISWTRTGSTSAESVAGTIDSRGRFHADGEGHDDAPGKQSRWLVQASGTIDPRTQRLQASVSLLRSKDRSLARNCTLGAQLR